MAPYFGARVKWSPRLSVDKMILEFYWNVEIPYFGGVFEAEQNVSWFNVPMDDVFLVQGRYCIDKVLANFPNFLLSKKLWAFSFGFDTASEVAPRSQLHHCTQILGCLVEEWLLESNNVGVVKEGENMYFVECIPLVLLLEFSIFDSLHRVLLPID